MIDVKKLITGFLILAVAASASALLIATVSSGGGVKNAVGGAAIVTQNDAQPAPKLTDAFLNEPTGDATGNAIPTSNDSVVASAVPDPTIQALASDPNNLTNQLAAAFAAGVVTANPSGPEQNGQGNPSLSQPDMKAIAMTIENATATEELAAPNWDYEADAQPIKIKNTASASDVSEYSAALSDIVGKHFVSNDIQNIVNSQTPDPSQVGMVHSELQAALGDTLALQVPSQLADFQKSLVTMLVYEKNMVGLVQNANTDPLKTALIVQNEKTKYEVALSNLETQIKKASAVNGFSFGQPLGTHEDTGVAFINALFGVKTAHAQWVTFDPSNLGEWILQFVENIALQILKDTLIALLQKNVLSWIQGKNGIPRFLTSWASTVANSYINEGLSVLNSQMSCAVAPVYAASVKSTLSVYYQVSLPGLQGGGGGGTVCANPLQASLGGNTLGQFFNNFSAGGWDAYGVSLLPSGNFYGGAFFQAQAAEFAADQNQQATYGQSVASQGLTGDETCGDGSNPYGMHMSCEDSNGVDVYPTNGVCDPGYRVVYLPNGGLCANGSHPYTTTPGITTSHALNSAIDSGPQLVVSANDITGILDSLTSSLINSLTTTINGGLLGVNGNNINGGGGAPPPPPPLVCNPGSQIASSSIPVSMGATGGSTDPNGNSPTYTWLASDGATGSGYLFSHAFLLPGAYTVTLRDNTNDPPATCHVTVQ
ncbi:MAG TPA: PKD domain-containing protein [Candidatus Paceibacterota bacterium]|nr:PKD domain-containing protein [Candidatus Paceibacterota bacterium]